MNFQHVLLIEDDPMIIRALKIALQMEGFKLEITPNLECARGYIEKQIPNLVLLDVNLPDGNGVDFCVELKRRFPDLPVLMLTAQVDEAAAVRGLKAGADDYIRKPFGNQELIARMQKWLAPSPTLQTQKLVTLGTLKIDPIRRHVSISDAPLELSRGEFTLLLLLTKKNGIVGRDEILEALGDQGDKQDRSVDSNISRLRAKLKKSGHPEFKISARYGEGYLLEFEEGDT